MTPTDAIRGLGDNPLYRLERRRQWRGARVSLVFLGVLCCGCGYIAPFVLAPAFAALAVIHDKRAQTWEDLLLTRLSSAEIVAAKAAAAIQIPAAIAALTALLVGAVLLIGAAFGPLQDAAEIVKGVVIALPGAIATVAAVCAALAAGCLMGIRAGLHYRDGFSAVAGACLATLALEVLIVACMMLLLGRSLWSDEMVYVLMRTPAATAGLSSAITLQAAFFTLANALLASGLWASCVHAVRRGES